MTLFRDLSGNGRGVEVEPHMNVIDFASGDKVVPGKSRYLRAGGAGNITLRPAGGSADIVIAVAANEYIPIDPGSTIRQTGTSVASLLATE